MRCCGHVRPTPRPHDAVQIFNMSAVSTSRLYLGTVTSRQNVSMDQMQDEGCEFPADDGAGILGRFLCVYIY
jgi:hypothetical protein